MKKNQLSICIFFFITFISTAFSQEINYIPYYQLVNKAKIAQCQNKCDSAIAYYLQAFERVDYILVDDLHDFVRCAALEEKDSLIYWIMDKCVEQIVPLSFVFCWDTLLTRYENTEKWQMCFVHEQATIDKYKEKYNCPYRKIIDSLVVSDQEVRNKWNWFCRMFPKSKMAKKRHQQWWTVDSSNRVVIDELVKKYDYPNERNGCTNHPCHQAGMIVIFHYDDTNFFFAVEHKALIEGKFSPDCYARKARRVAIIFNLPLVNYTYRYRKKMTTEEKMQVDKNRYEIGLPSIEEEKIIIRYNWLQYQQRQELLKQQKNN
jgi:hypothetical protein